MSETLEMMSEFPLLSSWNDGKYWTGFIQPSSGALIRLVVKCPNFPSSSDCSLHGDSDTREIFQKLSPQIRAIHRENKDKPISVVEFIRRVSKVLDQEKAENVEGETFAHNAQFYLAVLKELETIGSENVERLSKNFSDLGLHYHDSYGRKHILNVKIAQKNYSKVIPTVNADLPLMDGAQWPCTLVDCYSRFKQEVEKFSQFFAVMEELDRNVRVLEPMAPRRCDLHRRFVLDNSSNVVITVVVDPVAPFTMPDLTFSGPEHRIKHFEQLVEQNLESWKESCSLLDNLENVLEQEINRKNVEENDMENGGEDEDDLESVCVICYAYEFQGESPEVGCECGAIYHNKCLADLLVNDPAGKSTRGCVDCPACEIELKVSKAHQPKTW